MKKQIALSLFALLLWSARALSQAPSWPVDASAWQHSMSLRAEIWLDGQPLGDPSALLGAFSGSELRGAGPGLSAGGASWHYLAIFSGSFSGDEIRFQAYVPSLGQILPASQRLVFQKNASAGLGAQAFRIDLRTDGDFPPALLDFPAYESVSPAEPDTVFLPDFLVSADGDPVSWSAAAGPNVSAQIVGGDKLVVRRLNANWSGSSAAFVTATETGTGQQHSATKAVSFSIHPQPASPDLSGAIPAPQRWHWPGHPFPQGDLKPRLSQPAPACVNYSMRFLPPTGSDAAPGWAAPAPSAGTMSLTARALHGGQDFPGEGLVMAAFVGGELAGLASPTSAAGQRLYFLSLAPVGSGPIALKLYDPVGQKIHEKTLALSYQPQGAAGTALAPVEAEYAPLLPSIGADGLWSVSVLDAAWEGELTARFYAFNCAEPEKTDSLDAVFHKTSCEPGNFYADNDGDGHGAGAAVGFGCVAPVGKSRLLGDCADGDAARFPGNAEICDGKDNDCLNGVPYTEADADGDGWRICAGDCDDASAAKNPGASEACNGYDDDCDGLADLADPGFSDLAPPVARCRNVSISLSNGQATATAALLDDGSSDDCSATVSLSILSGATAYDCGNAAQSPFTVSLQAADASGNTASCQSQVTVSDALAHASAGKRTAPDGLAGERLGWSAALQGSAAASGAAEAKVGANNKQGAAYIFCQNAPTANAWGHKKKIWAPDGAAIDYFGNALSLDGSLLLAGAYGDNVGAKSDQGTAAIFEKNLGGADNWGHRKQVSASDGAAYDYFGQSAALRGATALVGANKAKIGANAAQGAAYVFQKDMGGADNWGQAKKLAASDGAANHFFGQSVALSPDGATAFAGAPGSQSNRGAAYVFQKDMGGANNWGQAKKIQALDGASGDWLGASAAATASHLILGAPNKASYKGAAYVFQKDMGGANNWGQQKKVQASDAAANARFGSSVALDGDYAYVGAIGADGRGAVYVFQKDNGGAGNWGQVGKYYPPDAAAGDQNGFSVAASGEWLAVGANLDDVSGKADQGSLALFAGAPACPGSLAPAGGAGERQAAQNAAALSLRCEASLFQSELRLEAEAPAAARLEVFDALGRPLASMPVPPGRSEWHLGAADWPAGAVFIRLRSEAGAATAKAAKW